MFKKKSIIVSIVVVLVMILVVGGFTYSFLVSQTNEENVDNVNTGKLDVIYSISGDITGTLLPSSSRSSGLISTATARISEYSVPAAFNLYITPTIIDGLNISALKWEVEGIKDGNIVYSNSGNFSGATVNTPIIVVNSYNLDITDTTFNIYIWLDGSMLNSSLGDKRFVAKISADSVPITGSF